MEEGQDGLKQNRPAGPAGFRAGLADDSERNLQGCEMGCAGVFYLLALVQFSLFIVVLATGNAVIPDGGKCPPGYLMYSDGFYCLKESLREDYAECAKSSGRRLDDEPLISTMGTFDEHLHKVASMTPVTPREHKVRNLAERRLAGKKVPGDLWQFLEEYVQMPITIFASSFAVGAIWLFAIAKATGPVVWGTLAMDIGIMIAGVIYLLAEFGDFNYMLCMMAIFFTVGIYMARDKIRTAIVVMHKAMEGLMENGRLFPINFGITILWIGFFALWISSLIGLDLAKTFGDDDGKKCQLVNKYPGSLRYLWIMVYYWVTFFFNNSKLIIIASQLSEWYFEGDAADKSIWIKGLMWAFDPRKSAGANAIASAIMGGSQWLMSYLNSKTRIILAMMDPIEWIPLCLAFALKTLVHTYTKFGLIAQVYSGENLCSVAGKTFKLLKNYLGEAVICDYIGKRVLSWCTYLVSLGVAMAALTWGNALQEFDEANQIFESVPLLIGTMLFLAWVVSFPFASIVFVIMMENVLPNDMDTKWRAIFNSVFAAIFMGSVSQFLWTTMSHIVVSAMDVIYFCYAIERDMNYKQERFSDLYEAIDKTIVDGAPEGQGVVMGQAVGGQSAPKPEHVQSAPASDVIGVPMGQNGNQAVGTLAPNPIPSSSYEREPIRSPRVPSGSSERAPIRSPRGAPQPKPVPVQAVSGANAVAVPKGHKTGTQKVSGGKGKSKGRSQRNSPPPARQF